LAVIRHVIGSYSISNY